MKISTELKAKVLKVMIKRGSNEGFAKVLIEKNLQFAVGMYEKSTPAKLADIIVCL